MTRLAAAAAATFLASCGRPAGQDAGTGATAPAPAAGQAAPGPDAIGTETVAYAVTGMHCGGCAEAIVAEVGEVKGVRSVRCTFESKVAVIELEDPAARQEAERAITKMGYVIARAPADGAALVPAEPAPAHPPESR